VSERQRLSPLQILSAELAEDFRMASDSVRNQQVSGRLPPDERTPWTRKANRDTFLVIEHERRRLVERRAYRW
jgi:hypothetical protein